VNKLHVGFSKEVELLPKGGYIYIADEVPEVSRARVFDPLKHRFNPLKDITYRKAREIADILYTVSPQGENTLTDSPQRQARAFENAARRPQGAEQAATRLRQSGCRPFGSPGDRG
jgi:hypothetical protein